MDIISKISLLVERGAWGQPSHPGILEVPEGKDVQSLPLKHFQALAKSKGEGAVVKALMNLVRWNSSKNPSLATWAKGMVNKLHGGSKEEE